MSSEGLEEGNKSFNSRFVGFFLGNLNEGVHDILVLSSLLEGDGVL